MIRHGVAALVWQNITDLGLAEAVPEQERLPKTSGSKQLPGYHSSPQRPLKLSQSLEKEGIRTLLLKGLALEHTVYGSRGLRQMSDADLLVAPEDALRAQDILIKAGFISRPMKSPLYRHIIFNPGNHLPELHRRGISVDLHTGFSARRAEPLSEEPLRGRKRFPSPAELFLYFLPGWPCSALSTIFSSTRLKGSFS